MIVAEATNTKTCFFRHKNSSRINFKFLISYCHNRKERILDVIGDSDAKNNVNISNLNQSHYLGDATFVRFNKLGSFYSALILYTLSLSPSHWTSQKYKNTTQHIFSFRFTKFILLHSDIWVVWKVSILVTSFFNSTKTRNSLQLLVCAWLQLSMCHALPCWTIAACFTN